MRSFFALSIVLLALVPTRGVARVKYDLGDVAPPRANRGEDVDRADGVDGAPPPDVHSFNHMIHAFGRARQLQQSFVSQQLSTHHTQ